MGGSVVKSKKRRRQPPLAHRVETVLELPGGTLSGEARIEMTGQPPGGGGELPGDSGV